MQRIIARSGIFDHNDAVTSRVSIERSRTHARVQVHAGNDQCIGSEIMQNQIELFGRKSTEKRLMDDRFLLVRT